MKRILGVLFLCTFVIFNEAVIIGSKSCPSTGTFDSMECTGCFQAPCSLTVNTNYTMTINFISGETTANLQWQVWLYTPGGGVSQIQNLPVLGEIIEGTYYFITHTVDLAERFAGIPGEIAILILDNTDGSRVMCGEFAVEISDAIPPITVA